MDLRTTFNKDEYNYDKARPGYPGELFEDIFDYADLCSDSNVLEIGIGTGQATLPFLQQGCKLTAVELGDRLAGYCKQKFSAFDNFSIINSMNRNPGRRTTFSSSKVLNSVERERRKVSNRTAILCLAINESACT